MDALTEELRGLAVIRKRAECIDAFVSEIRRTLAECPRERDELRITAQSAILTDCVNQLPERERQAMTLHYLQGKSIAECAEAMFYSIDGMNGLLQRAKRQLTQIIYKIKKQE